MKCNPQLRSLITLGRIAYRKFISNTMSTIQGNWYYRCTGTFHIFLPWTEIFPRLISSLQKTPFTFLTSCYLLYLVIQQTSLNPLFTILFSLVFAQDSNSICRSSSSTSHKSCDTLSVIETLHKYSPPVFVGTITHWDTSAKMLHHHVWSAGTSMLTIYMEVCIVEHLVPEADLCLDQLVLLTKLLWTRFLRCTAN